MCLASSLTSLDLALWATSLRANCLLPMHANSSTRCMKLLSMPLTNGHVFTLHHSIKNRDICK
jgi:hypothetical protein